MSERKQLTHGSLFTGIGGFDLAAERVGWDNIFHCEFDKNKQIDLKRNFPKSISYGDITTTDFTIHRGAIDVLTGGFPCQDASIAKQDGKGQKGLQGERTGLFYDMCRAIDEIRPKVVVAENVGNILKTNGGGILGQSCKHWPEWGIMQSGECVMLQRSVRPISVKGCISLLTPTASDCKRDKLSFPMYQRRHYRSPGCLSKQLYRLVGAVHGVVNPRFYAWMMGYPLRWLESNCTDMETQ